MLKEDKKFMVRFEDTISIKAGVGHTEYMARYPLSVLLLILFTRPSSVIFMMNWLGLGGQGPRHGGHLCINMGRQILPKV